MTRVVGEEAPVAVAQLDREPRVPGGDDTLVDVTRELGAPALRAIVPAIAPQETSTAATLAMHDAFVAEKG